MAQQIRLRTSIKQWKSQTKHNHRCGKEKQHLGSRKLPETPQQQFATKTQPRSVPQKVTPQVLHYNPRTRLREKSTTKQQHTPPKEWEVGREAGWEVGWEVGWEGWGWGEGGGGGGARYNQLEEKDTKQPTPQEMLEHNVTHLPYRSWCPKQHSKLPIVQLDFGYIKRFDDSNVHPILTAIDIQSGMIMAQLTATALPH